MEGVTLLESGASRAQFALVKQLERAPSAQRADEVVQRAVQDVQESLGSKSSSAFTESFLVSQLLVVLHAHTVYPHGEEAQQSPPLNVSFIFVPALHLLAVAQRAKSLQVAYLTLALLFGPSSTSFDDKEASVLLLLNTLRQHLSPAKVSKGKGKQVSREEAAANQDSASLEYARRSFALRSIVMGIPAGADAVPALYGPVFALLSHNDDLIKTRAVEALLVLAGYRDDDGDVGMARATWQSVQSVLMAIKDKRQEVMEGPESMARDGSQVQRAFLKAAHFALYAGAIDVNEYVEAVTRFTGMEKTVWQQMKAVRAMQVAIAARKKDLRLEIADQLFAWSAECLSSHSSSYPLQLEIASLLGSCPTNAKGSAEGHHVLQTVWEDCKSHLLAQNANRKIVGLRILETLLPFNWPTPSDGSSIQLQDSEMGALLETLKNRDSSVRTSALYLFARIDAGLLDAHLDALSRALSSKERIDDAESLALRICEVLEVLCCRHDPSRLSSTYAAKLAFLLKSPHLQTNIIEALVSNVVAHWREHGQQARQALKALIAELHDGHQPFSPTSTLMVATLVCELLGPGEDEKETHAEILALLASCLPQTSEVIVPLQEAFLVSMIKLAAVCEAEQIQSIVKCMAKYAESSASTLVKERVLQLSGMSGHDRSSEHDLAFGPASLLTTLDMVDKYINSNYKALPQMARQKLEARREAKPLQYDAYESPDVSLAGQERMSGSSSIETAARRPKQKPFRVLPTPSSMRSRLLAKERANEATKQEMQQSVSRLLLAEEDNEFDEYDEKLETSERVGSLF